jgi:hypothetical protein
MFHLLKKEKTQTLADMSNCDAGEKNITLLLQAHPSFIVQKN